MMYRPSELNAFLNELGIAPKKGLSQNFLIDGNIIRKIVAKADVSPGDIILEIGPGPGALTQGLLDAGAHVFAVDKDAILSKALERLKKPENVLNIFCEDILTFPIEEILLPHLAQGKKAKVIANLPYHLTTPILVQLVPMRHLFSSLTVMVQEEVARRFTAKAGEADYGSFSVFLSFYTDPFYEFFVSRNCFYPAPRVDSAVVRLDLKEPPAVDDVEGFFKMTRTAFSHRRKMLRGALKDLYESSAVTKALEALGQNPLARPEELSLETFLDLFKLLSS
jgi:16S rRNA (adenine1518-N6/adenine1519-N6)-dimethyltransferase